MCILCYFEVYLPNVVFERGYACVHNPKDLKIVVVLVIYLIYTIKSFDIQLFFLNNVSTYSWLINYLWFLIMDYVGLLIIDYLWFLIVSHFVRTLEIESLIWQYFAFGAFAQSYRVTSLKRRKKQELAIPCLQQLLAEFEFGFWSFAEPTGPSRVWD